MVAASIEEIRTERKRKIEVLKAALTEVGATRSRSSLVTGRDVIVAGHNGWEENFQPNHFYGIATIIRTLLGGYIGPLPLIFPHMIRDYRSVWSLELILSWPIAAYSDYAYWTYLRAANSAGSKSSPFMCRNPMRVIRHLLDEALRASDSVADSGSAVYFPDHSTGRIKGKLPSIDTYKEIALEMRKSFTRIAICIYHLDLNNYIRGGELGEIAAIFDAVLCCGDRHEADFLVKLAGIFSDYPNVYVESLGSVVYFAESWGCRIYWNRRRGVQLYSDGDLLGTGDDARFWKTFDQQLEASRITRLATSELVTHDVSRNPQLSRFVNVSDGECELTKIFLQIVRSDEVFLSSSVLAQIHKYVE